MVKKIKAFVKLDNSDFNKDENRGIVFLEKIKAGSKFATVNKGDVTIPKDLHDEVMVHLQAKDEKYPNPGTSIVIQTSNGKLKIPNDFLKTGEFGGRGEGSGTDAETAAMNDFNNKLNKLLKSLKKSSVAVMINRRRIECAQMVKTVGKYNGKEPKSDMTIIDANNNPVAYISHKAGSSAKDFQQYGGVSNMALPTRYHNNLEIKSFMEAVLRERPEGLASGDQFYKEVKDASLVKIMMYGPEYASKRPGISNVDEFHLGNMSLQGAKGATYKIISSHKGTNGDMPRGDYAATFIVRAQFRRSPAVAAGVTVENARIMVAPKALVSRKAQAIL